MKRIYLDYAATTPVDPAVLEYMQPYFRESFGNPGSLHAFGQEAIAAVDRARETVAGLIGADFREIIFTASATEADNLALRGAVAAWKKAHPHGTPHIMVSAIEHEAVLHTARDLGENGARVTYVPVDAAGKIDLKNIKENLTSETAIVSVMHANNEIGAIEPVRDIAEIVSAARGNDAYPLFHTDAAQTFQFLDCGIKNLGADLMTLSSHKIYGPKGAGALYVRHGVAPEPLITGGGQEFGLRSGTENVPSIAGFAKAAEIAVGQREKESSRIEALRGLFWEEVHKIAPRAELNGGPTGLPNILSIYFPEHEAEDLLTRMDLDGLAASSGSACRSRALESSHVIQALGHPKARARSSIRFSFGRPTTKDEVLRATSLLKKLL